MKKIILSVASIIGATAAFAQVNVSTAVEKKTAVLEEFTGNFCTYCPDGHKIADQIAANPSFDVITIKIQTGGFSGTDPIFGGNLQTPDGQTIASSFATSSYPNGSVQRRVAYKGLGRGSWQNAVQTINSEDAPVNLYLESTIDVTTRELTVDAEYYYTATQPNSTNKLVIGYYQDNIPAYQYDPGFYPSQFYILSEELYEFDHAYRGMINGITGEVIANSSATSTAIVSRSFTLPAAFSTFAVEAGAVKVFAYVIESAGGEILNAAKTTPVYSNFPETDEIGIIYTSKLTDENCLGAPGNFGPKMLVGTYGGSNLTSFDYDFGINGSSAPYSWTGNVAHNEKVVVNVPAAPFTYVASNSIDLSVSDPNGNTDNVTSNNDFTSSFNGGTTGTASMIRIDITGADQYAPNESEFELLNSTGTVVLASGALPQGNSTFQYSIPAGTECYRIKMIDSYGDGWGVGTTCSMKIYDITGGANTLVRTLNQADNFGSENVSAIEFTSTLAINELEKLNLNVYPNPAEDILNVSFDATDVDFSVVVMDFQGRVISPEFKNDAKGMQTISIPVADLASGSYLVSISSATSNTTKKVTIK